MGYIDTITLDERMDIGEWQEYYDRDTTRTCSRCKKIATATPQGFEAAGWRKRTCDDCYCNEAATSVLIRNGRKLAEYATLVRTASRAYIATSGDPASDTLLNAYVQADARLRQFIRETAKEAEGK